MKYNRVLPRDLFNEAKLFKCMGRIVMLIEDGIEPFGKLTYFGKYQSGFSVLCDDDGHLRISNLRIYYKGQQLFFRTVINSKSNYPVHCWYENVEIPVLTDAGDPDPEFEKFLASLYSDEQ